jgi:arylsulfatase A-like enzyme
MLRTREFKYNRHQRWGEELYDLRNDPDELHNLADSPGSRRRKRELSAELDRWMAQWRDPFGTLSVTDRAGKPLA